MPRTTGTCFQGEIITGYTMWLSARDTEDWARKPGASLPGSTIAGHRIVVCVDKNGIYDFTMDGKDSPEDVDGAELDAIVADHLPAKFWHLWPTLEVKPEVSSEKSK